MLGVEIETQIVKFLEIEIHSIISIIIVVVVFILCLYLFILLSIL